MSIEKYQTMMGGEPVEPSVVGKNKKATSTVLTVFLE